MLNHEQRKHLKKLAITLDPIIWIGKEGVADGLIKNTRAGLLAHELIKVKVNQNNSDEKRDLIAELASAVGADVIHTIGRIGVLYRPHPEKPTIKLPKQKAAKAETE